MKKLASILLIAFVLHSCKKGGGSKPEPVLTSPVLVAPAKNDLCTEGREASSTESIVSFSWKSENAESYTINIKNLLSGETMNRSTTELRADFKLLKNTPYSWFVTSKKGTVAATSETWKLYNAGESQVSYAPFPADLIFPLNKAYLNATSGKIALTWKGTDPDNDIAGYEVYIGSALSNMVLLTSITTIESAEVSVESNRTYYWKVITKDFKGNKSESGVFQFQIN